jgi:hypothetical protein
MNQILSKLELNILDAKTKPEYVSDFVLKNRIPVIVASPEYIAQLSAQRAVRRGQYKLVCALDFTRGDNFALDKIWRSNPDLVEADGFDILISVHRSEIEIGNEMKALYEFIKMNKPMTEVRWCLRMHSLPEEGLKVLKHTKSFSPTFIRVDPHLMLPNLTLEDHKTKIKIISEHTPFPIKVSGNITLEIIEELLKERGVKRFDVSLEQAEVIVKTLPQATNPASFPKSNVPAVKKGKFNRIRL